MGRADWFGPRSARARALGRRRLRSHEGYDMRMCEVAARNVREVFGCVEHAHALYCDERRVQLSMTLGRKQNVRVGRKNRAITVRPFATTWAILVMEPDEG